MATANMGLTMPTEDGSSGVWDTLLNTLIELIDANEHTSCKGVKVPSSGLNINANLSFAGYDVSNMGEIGFTAVDTGTLAKGLRVKTDNELYWRTSGGVDVQLTNGTTLNTSLVGGITGDYSTSDADVEYNDTSKYYQFKQDESPDFYAKIKCADLHLYEEASGITNYVALKSPGSLAATYTWTWPAALPGANSIVQVDNTGALTNDTSLPDFDVGTITVNTDMVLPEFTKTIHASGGAGTNGAVGATGEVTASGAMNWYLPVNLNVGDRIKSVRFNYDRQGVNVQMSIIRNYSGSAASLGSYNDTASVGYQYYTLDITDHTVLADSHYAVYVTTPGANPILQGVQVVWDRP